MKNKTYRVYRLYNSSVRRFYTCVNTVISTLEYLYAITC